MAEKQYYEVKKLTKTDDEEPTTATKITRNLGYLHASHGTHFDDREEFISKLLSSDDLQKMIGVEITKVDAADIEDHPQYDVIRAFDARSEIEERYAETEAKATKIILDWLQKNITDKDDLKTFCTDHGVSTKSLQVWARRLKKSDDFTLTDEFIKVHAETAHKYRSEKTQDKRTVNQLIRDFYPPKKSSGADASKSDKSG